MQSESGITVRLRQKVYTRATHATAGPYELTINDLETPLSACVRV